jgi:hypothetical protein
MAVDLRRDPATRTSALRRVGEQRHDYPKELVVIDSNVHLLFHEDIDQALPPLLQRLDVADPTSHAPDVGRLA